MIDSLFWHPAHILSQTFSLIGLDFWTALNLIYNFEVRLPPSHVESCVIATHWNNDKYQIWDTFLCVKMAQDIYMVGGRWGLK